MAKKKRCVRRKRKDDVFDKAVKGVMTIGFVSAVGHTLKKLK